MLKQYNNVRVSLRYKSISVGNSRTVIEGIFFYVLIDFPNFYQVVFLFIN